MTDKMIIYRFEKINGVWHWNYNIRPYDRVLYKSIEQVKQTASKRLEVVRWNESKEYWDAETEASCQEGKLIWIYGKRDKDFTVLQEVER